MRKLRLSRLKQNFENVRVKEKLEQLPCEQFLQVFEISHSFLRAKQVGEKRGKIQNPVKIAHKAAVLFFLSLQDSLIQKAELSTTNITHDSSLKKEFLFQITILKAKYLIDSDKTNHLFALEQNPKRFPVFIQLYLEFRPLFLFLCMIA